MFRLATTTCITALGFILSSSLTAFAQPVSKPNIVFIMADDLGFADVGYRGSPIKTPNIDKLANEGVRMDSFYGAAVCTPSRAMLMTGRYPMRYGLQTLVIFPSHTYGLATGERTLPQALFSRADDHVHGQQSITVQKSPNPEAMPALC